MKKEESDKGYSFTLKKIHLIEKSLSLVDSTTKNEEFTFDVSLQIGNNAELKETIHIMQVLINTKKNKSKAGSIKLACSFFIPNSDEYSTGNNVSLPQDFIYLLNTVVIGTMRGVMYSEFRGTILNNAYLPVLDPKQFELIEDK